MLWFPQLGEFGEEFTRWQLNVRMSKRIRQPKVEQFEGYTFSAARKEDLKAIEALHLMLFRQPMVRWLRFLYKVRPSELIGVVKNAQGELCGYDCFMFNEVEVQDRIIHEQYVGIAPKFQGQGLSTRLRRYSISCYDDGFITGVSTLAPEHDIKALRSAQKSGYAIIKMSAKPPAYYLYQKLHARYPDSPVQSQV
ncbi:MAG: hypothetical protein K6F05_08615 [Succinivibrio sp.]|nr:hypothetical protein [Succinivibrio sp.]